MKYIPKPAFIVLFGMLATVAFFLLMSYQSSSQWGKSSAVVQLENAFPHLTFSQPVEFTHAGDGSNRVFVIEQKGKIRVFENNISTKKAEIYLDIEHKVSSEGEMGLLGLAFHPNFKQNGYFYVNYTKRNPLETIIARYKVVSSAANQVKASSETILLKISQPYDNHNGGKIAFGPDGFLYIALGDGGAWGDQHNYAQNLTSLLGKILRIDIDKTDKGKYGIPVENPYLDNKEGFREEIYAYGLRNPWRFSFDNKTGKMWVGDVGQKEFEEIDIITKGGNYGWRLKEAKKCYNPIKDCGNGNLIEPIYHYPRSEGVSITGGFVYRGASVPLLQGKYIYADYGSGKVWALSFDGNKMTDNQLLTNEGGSVSAFGEDAKGELFVLDHNGGTIKRFVAKWKEK